MKGVADLISGVSYHKGGRKINLLLPREKTNNRKQSFVHIRIYIKKSKNKHAGLTFYGFCG